MEIKKALRWTLSALGLTTLVAAVALLILNEVDAPKRVTLLPWPPVATPQGYKGYLLLLGLTGDPGEDQLKAGERAQAEIDLDPKTSLLRKRWEGLNAKLLKHFIDSRYRTPAEIEKNRTEIDKELSPLREDIARYFAVIRNGTADVDFLKTAGWPPSNGISLLSLSKAVNLQWNVELAGGHYKEVIAQAREVWKFHRANLEVSSSLLETMITFGSMAHVRDFINDAGYDNPAFRKELTPEVLASLETTIDPLEVLKKSREWELGWINQMLTHPTPLGEPWNSPLSRHFIAQNHNRILNSVDDLWSAGMRGEDYVRPWTLQFYPFAYGATTVLHFDLKHQLSKCQQRATEFAQPIAFTPPKVAVKSSN